MEATKCVCVCLCVHAFVCVCLCLLCLQCVWRPSRRSTWKLPSACVNVLCGCLRVFVCGACTDSAVTSGQGTYTHIHTHTPNTKHTHRTNTKHTQKYTHKRAHTHARTLMHIQGWGGRGRGSTDHACEAGHLTSTEQDWVNGVCWLGVGVGVGVGVWVCVYLWVCGCGWRYACGCWCNCVCGCGCRCGCTCGYGCGCAWVWVWVWVGACGCGWVGQSLLVGPALGCGMILLAATTSAIKHTHAHKCIHNIRKLPRFRKLTSL